MSARLRADLARQLEQAVPEGWAVSTGCPWAPDRSGGLVLHPHVAVHRPRQADGGLPAPPTLCVDITPGRPDGRAARPYARFGVDHYWHLDSRSGVLEVFVRVEQDYRHAESIAVDGVDVVSGLAPWVDFGIGVLELALRADPSPRPGGPSGA